MTDKELLRILSISSAIREMLEIFAEQEIGNNIEIDEEALAEYMSSERCIADYFEAKTKEEMYEIFLKQLLNGYPVWQMLKVSDWTKNMLNREFQKEIEEQDRKMKESYACLSCKYYSCVEVELGALHRCKGSRYIKSEDGFSMKRFTLQETCEKYEKGRL